MEVGNEVKENATGKNERECLDSDKVSSAAKTGEAIVISGISGAFPYSDNVREFRDNLYNKIDMVRPNRRWGFANPEIPSRSGTIPEIGQFDSGYFGIHQRQADSLDIQTSVLHEKVIEAIFDAGMHPSDLQNSRTGVYSSICYSENEKKWYFEKLDPQTFSVTGSEKSMMPHRLSYLLKLKGPSHTTDSACSSSLYALEHAFRAIRLGEVDNAIITGTNLCLHPFVTLQFARLGVLSEDGCCKTFDEKANGYVRSEAIGVIILQKAKVAKRVYAEVVYAKTNCDGFKENGITFPSRNSQRDLLNDFYDECGIDRFSLSFLEAHGTGTVIGDPEECSAIDEVLTKNRKNPLLIGAVKSNMGHAESASGVCSIIKCIIGMETGFIPPNIWYNTPRSAIKAFTEGRMKVVTEKTAFEDDRALIGINGFGFGGGNCHVLLRRNCKTKQTVQENLDRLVCLSGRTQQAVNSLLDSVVDNKFDPEYIKLLHDGFRKNVENHLYRGYTILSQSGELARSINFLKYFPSNAPPVYFVFGELKNWYQIGNDLTTISGFSTHLERVQTILSKHHLNILVFHKKDCNKDIGSVLGSTVVQMGIIDLFDLMGLKACNKFGYSVGKLLSAYYEGTLSFEDTINYAFAIDKALNDSRKTLTSTNNQEEKNKPFSEFCADLKTTDLIGLKRSLLKYLDVNKGKNVNSLVDVLFDGEIHHKRTENSIVLKIGDSVLEKSEDTAVITLFHGKRNCFVEFLNGLGSLYEFGYNPQISKLYPSVELPVSRGTEMISPYIKWNHRTPKYIPQYNVEGSSGVKHGSRTISIHTDNPYWAYITDHVIDGKNIFPATGYLYLVWETFAAMKDTTMDVMHVCFENCKFLRMTPVPKKGYFSLQVNISKGSGYFEVLEEDSLIVTGRISILDTKKTSRFQYKPNYSLEREDVTLVSKDIYKELRLRGYEYKGEFQAIEECNLRNGLIKWNENWVALMDNMLQMALVTKLYDSRLLYVPTTITKLTIQADVLIDLVATEKMKDPEVLTLPVTADSVTDTISCGGIKFEGLIANPIPRKKLKAIPVLETYTFVPNDTDLSLEQSVRVNLQIVLENSSTFKVKAVELVDEFTDNEVHFLSPIVKSVIKDEPSVQTHLKVLSETPLDVVDIEVENNKLRNECECLIVIASKIFSRYKMLEEAFSVLLDDGFVLSRECRQFTIPKNLGNIFFIFTIHRTPTETLVLLRKMSMTKEPEYIRINESDNFSWLPQLQNSICNFKNKDIVLYADNEPKNGIIGLVKCLRREPQSKHVRCVFAMDKMEKFKPQEPFYDVQLKKQMAVNIYKNGQWGTYRHLLLDKEKVVEKEHSFLKMMVRGDLSNLRWVEGPLRSDMKQQQETELIYIYYAALNFKDIMIASGKLNAEVSTRGRFEHEYVQGFEFSGRDAKGNRYMGTVVCGAQSSMVVADTYLKFPVPENWSLEEAATVPVVYGTVLYSLILCGQMKKGQSILIHSGTGGIGQAAIRLALGYGCRVFTTVGSEEKREFLMTTFPQLEEADIGNSHDESFDQLIHARTNGRGVDLVLNSLAEEKLITSIRCLARGGRFIEIGKFDAVNDHSLNTLLLRKDVSFHSVILECLFNMTPEEKKVITELMIKYIKQGIVQPLNRTIFKYDEVEQAYRFMASGKHKGKVLIQIREPEEQLVVPPGIRTFPCMPRFCCNPDKVYMILGGLGGFGLELADWLILRGAKKLILTSRKGVTTGYQSYKLYTWKNYDVMVKVSTTPITTKEGCKQLLEEALKFGPIDGIFNLAVVLADAVFANQTIENFSTSFKPKAYATEYLDQLTRKMCPDLSTFVVFSSISCGRGNADQTNYSMSNSVMERICEDRKRNGYPALAIEWGAIGEIGLVAEMVNYDTKIEISGTVQQRISNCLQVMDILLGQDTAAIVSSMVVAEKRTLNAEENIIDTVINILGLTDSKSISFQATFSELGMDSITTVEIKQILETEFEVFLTAKEIRKLTLAKLKDIQNDKSAQIALQDTNLLNFGFETIFSIIGDETLNSLPVLQLSSKVPLDVEAPTLIMFGGIEGSVKSLQDFSKHIAARTIGIQLNLNGDENTIQEMALSVTPIIEKYCSNRRFTLLAYSYGSVIALEVANILESRGYDGTVICIDGSPLLVKHLMMNFTKGSAREIETWLLCYMFSFFMNTAQIEQHKEKIFKCHTWDQRLDLFMDILKQYTKKDMDYEKLVAQNIYKRVKIGSTYSPSFGKLRSKLKLFRPTVTLVRSLPPDYGLSEYSEKPVDVSTFEGNHNSILENVAVAEEVNSCF